MFSKRFKIRNLRGIKFIIHSEVSYNLSLHVYVNIGTTTMLMSLCNHLNSDSSSYLDVPLNVLFCLCLTDT